MMVLAVGPSMWRVGCVSSAMISICRADAQNVVVPLFIRENITINVK